MKRSYSLPDKRGHFGIFGGKFVPETLMRALAELELQYRRLRSDRKFKSELNDLLQNYAGRPTPITYARNLTRETGGARIYLKREDLLHTGAHKINNTIAQGLLAVRLGKGRLIAETGAGQHGIATATAARLFNLECDIFMGSVDMERQALNVYKMRLLGARVIPVHSGSKTLKDAMNEAIRDWVASVETTHYLIGSVAGPHPYPMMVRDFQSIIGREAARQFPRMAGKLPDAMVACVGGGSNALGLFYPFLESRVKLYGAEAAGLGMNTRHHAASLTKGTVGVLHGMKSLVLQNREGQIALAHSVSAGLDYPSVGPEHAWLSRTGRVRYLGITDREALRACERLSYLEGIIPALESAHAVALAERLARRMKRTQSLLVCLSGRGDKDMDTIRREILRK